MSQISVNVFVLDLNSPLLTFCTLWGHLVTDMFNSVSRKSLWVPLLQTILLLRSPFKRRQHLFYTKTQFMEQHISKSGPESVSSSPLLILKCSLFIDRQPVCALMLVWYIQVCGNGKPQSFQDFTPKVRCSEKLLKKNPRAKSQTPQCN